MMKRTHIKLVLARRHMLAAGLFLAASATSFAQNNEPVDGNISWSNDAAASLLAVADAAKKNGASVSTLALEEALQQSSSAVIDFAASALFVSMAEIEDRGYLPAEARAQWRIADQPIPIADISAQIERAAKSKDVATIIQSFAPPGAQYTALAKALAETPEKDAKTRQELEINLERWRWMPRNLGDSYILINVPAFEMRIVKNSAELYKGRVIVGAKKSPTPIFSTEATGAVINPTWFVPPSIVAESVGALIEKKPKTADKLGYYVSEDGGVRQKPGPDNALGRMKLVMPNPYSVYIHDTPNRQLFDKDVRALSHGCIRTDNALKVAELLLPPEWSAETIEAAVDAGLTVTVDFDSAIPVYVAYFTAFADGNGTVQYFPDIYGLDRGLSNWLESDGSAPAPGGAELSGCTKD